MSEYTGLRGRAWFKALTGDDQPRTGDPGSVLAADAQAGPERALFLCVVPNPDSRFPCVRDGQVGLEEAYALATRTREAIAADRDKPKPEKRPIVAIIDVKSQAYGRREETAGIFLAAAASADAYASARMVGHPVISLVVGHAFSGGFLTHGYQANRILAFDDAGVTIHAMHEEAAARITRRSVSDLERLGHEIAPMSYDVRDYAKLGTLYKLLHVNNPMEPAESDIAEVKQAVADAITDARMGAEDLGNRMNSPAAKETRKAGLAARALMEKQWATA
ncbi:MAG TPA: biotin-independent malonate decarboxylase subunit gamma [Acidobacteriaceae bacterium]|jgi:malonate decarboxylase gamma subunit|nr:biotin-independent malonate decarboxylase subunit gamma [Acidobacteriaceae bacterium]